MSDTADSQDVAETPTTDSPGDDKPEGRFLTTVELQRIATREGHKSVNSFVRDMGFDNADAAKSFFAEVKQRQDAEKTEAQREREAVEAERRSVEQERMQANTERHTAKVERQLLRAGVPPEQLDRLTRLVTAEVGADDDVIVADIEQLKVDLPQLFSQPAPEARKTPDSRVQGRPPSTQTVGDDPLVLGSKRAEEYAKRPGYNPLA